MKCKTRALPLLASIVASFALCLSSCPGGPSAPQNRFFVSSFSVGLCHVAAIAKDGSLWTWGSNTCGELGDGTTDKKEAPTRIGVDSDWKAVATGYYFTVAIKNDGTLWAWGENDSGQLGDGGATESHAPIQIGTDTDWSCVSAQYQHAFALKTNGSLWAWGDISQIDLAISGVSGDIQKVPTQVDTSLD